MTEYKIDLHNIDVKDMLKELQQALREKKVNNDDTVVIYGAKNSIEYNHYVDRLTRWMRMTVQFKNGA